VQRPTSNAVAPSPSDLCCCTAEVRARIPRFNAIVGAQKGAELVQDK